MIYYNSSLTLSGYKLCIYLRNIGWLLLYVAVFPFLALTLERCSSVPKPVTKFTATVVGNTLVHASQETSEDKSGYGLFPCVLGFAIVLAFPIALIYASYLAVLGQ